MMVSKTGDGSLRTQDCRLYVTPVRRFAKGDSGNTNDRSARFAVPIDSADFNDYSGFSGAATHLRPIPHRVRCFCRAIRFFPTMPPRQPKESHRYVDMWALPGIHPSNVELLQKLKTADSGHFTTHMDTVGTVNTMNDDSGKWEKTHLIGMRTDIWKADKSEMNSAVETVKANRKKELKREIKASGRLTDKQSEKLEEKVANDDIMQMSAGEIEKRRLVLKLFKTTGSRVRWCGTIEEVTVTEVHNSIGSNRTLLSFVVMLPQSELVTQIQQNHRTFRVPSVFTMSFYDETQMWHLTIKKRWVSIGADFEIEVNGESIGEIDGRLLSFGCDSYIDIDAHPLTASTKFLDMITLFTASVGYHKAMRKSVRRRVKAAMSGQGHCHLIDDEELRLRQNGRAAA